jgi:hypothetical protein
MFSSKKFVGPMLNVTLDMATKLLTTADVIVVAASGVVKALRPIAIVEMLRL